MVNDKKKFNKRKKEWRMENGEEERLPILHSPFSILQFVIRKLFSSTI